MKFTLVELAKLAFPTANISKFTENIAYERENQTKLPDTLIWLDYEHYIFLNSYTDESSIIIKGLIKTIRNAAYRELQRFCSNLCFSVKNASPNYLAGLAVFLYERQF